MASTPGSGIPVQLGTTERPACDVLVVGAGIAGVSVAYELSEFTRVVVLERESQPGYHATGRSVALFSEAYGHPVLKRLARASRPFFEHPPKGFSEAPLLRPRGVIHLADAERRGQLEEEMESVRDAVAGVRMLDTAEILARVPVLRPEAAAAAMLEPEAMDLDVHALQQGYVRGLRARGGRLVGDAEVSALEREGDMWVARTRAGTFLAPLLVNAAGAWADTVAAMAGATPAGLIPHRRTVFAFDPPAGTAVDAWPLVSEVGESFYFKSDAGRILASPADETPSPPCDAQPEEMDIALGADRIERATTLKVTRIVARWAGLRTFAPDRVPVVGMDPELPGFFWLAGQGGNGIQTAPALARLAAGLIAWSRVPADLADLGVEADALSPSRFGSRATGSPGS